jgi:amidase
VPSGPLIGEVPGGIAHEFALTRSVRDTAALLDAVCGPAPGDRYYVARPPRPFVEALDSDPRRLRVALHAESYWGRATAPEVRAAVEGVGHALEELGHSVEQASAPLDAQRLRTAHLVLWPWLLALTASGLAALAGRAVAAETVEAASLACIRRGGELSVGDAWRAAASQNATSRAWGDFLDEYDLFLCPTAATGPPEAGVPNQNDARHVTAEGWIDEVFSYIPYTPIANTTGQPSISLPLGTAADGLPIGVMLTAQTLREDLLIAAAAQLERALPWSERRPPLCAGEALQSRP